MSLPVSFASPRRSRAVTSPVAGLYLVKMCAVVCALALFLALPSHAQWNVVDQNGSPISQNNDGSYPLLGIPVGSGTSTYPADLDPDHIYYTCLFGPYYCPQFFGGTPLYGLSDLWSGLGAQGWAQNNYYGSQFYYNGTVNELLQGTIQNSTDAPLLARFQYTGGGTPPDYLNVLVSDSAYASAYVENDSLFGISSIPDSLLSAHVSVSDDLGLSLSADASPLFPGSQNDPPHTAGGGRLLRLPVIAGEARVSVPVHFSVTQVNEVPYGSWDGPIGYGAASSYFNAGISATVQTDNRAVAISSNFDNPTTYYSDPISHHQIPNVRQPDGSMAADILVPSFWGTPATYSPIISGNWGSNSTYSWQASLPNSSHQTLSETGIFNSTDLLGNKTIPDFEGIYHNPPVSDRDSDTITLTLKDGVDGATASNTYTVRFHHPHAVPINFRCTSVIAHSDGILEYHYIWESSTGNLADLVDCVVKERVAYEGNSAGTKYVDTSGNLIAYSPPPPFSGTYQNPEVYGGVSGSAGYLDDDHLPGIINAPYVAGSYGSTQFYIYTDETMDPTNPNEYAVLAGPIDIVRTVWAPGANWVYEITKYDAPVGASKSYGEAQKVLGPVQP